MKRKYLVVVAAVVVASGVAVWLLQGKPAPKRATYESLRADMIRIQGSNRNITKSVPERPAGIDQRLDAAKFRAFEAVYPPDTEAKAAELSRIYSDVLDSITLELHAIDRHTQWYELLTPARRTVYLLEQFEFQIHNNGFDQFYLNPSGDVATFLPATFREIGREDIAMIVEKANALFPDGPSRYREKRLYQLGQLPASVQPQWREIAGEFYKLDLPPGGLIQSVGMRLMSEHPEEFFRQ